MFNVSYDVEEEFVILRHVLWLLEDVAVNKYNDLLLKKFLAIKFIVYTWVITTKENYDLVMNRLYGIVVISLKCCHVLWLPRDVPVNNYCDVKLNFLYDVEVTSHKWHHLYGFNKMSEYSFNCDVILRFLNDVVV